MDVVGGVEAVTNIVEIELVHQLAISLHRLAQGHVNIATDLVHNNLALDLAANGILALHSRVQHVKVRNPLVVVGIFQLLAAIAALMLRIGSFQAGPAVVGSSHWVSCRKPARGVQVVHLQAAMGIHLRVTSGVHRVHRDL